MAAKTYDLTKAKVKFLNAKGKNASIGYTGTAIELDLAALDEEAPKQAYIQVTIGSGKNAKVLTKDELSGLEIQYANNVNKGKATVILSAKDSDENFSGSVAANFNIKSGSVKAIQVVEDTIASIFGL